MTPPKNEATRAIEAAGGKPAGRSRLDEEAPLRAVLFDVDGTLYYQQRLRLLVMAELALLPLEARSFARARRTWRILRVFREVREELRGRGAGEESLADLQYTEAARVLGEERARVEAVVGEWMHSRPLKYLRIARRRGLRDLLGLLEARGILVGALSDYPAREKLEALGIARSFSLVLSTTDPEINAFKPHPRGFTRACELWGIRPGEALYVGDRPSVDAAGAAGAGMRCAIFSSRLLPGQRASSSTSYFTVSSAALLRHAILH